MKTFPKTCKVCQQPFSTRWAKQEKCKVCQTADNMIYVGEKTSKCILCDNDFCARKKGADICGACEAEFRKPSGSIKGDCGITGAKDVWLLHPDVQISLQATTDPAVRKTVMRALAKKKRRRVEEGAV
jgi:hypothetical protein